MNTQEARTILAAYRPGIDDAADPQIAGALALAQSDAQLGQWFERQKSADAALRLKFKEIQIPIGLQTRILANRPQPKLTVLPQTSWWRNPSLLALAAAIVILLGVSAVWFRQASSPTLANYEAAMLNYVAVEDYKIEMETKDLNKAREFVAAKKEFPANYAVPKALETYPLEGICTFKWLGHNVTMLCYGSDADKKPDVWMLVIPRAALTDAPGAKQQFAQINSHPVATWTSGDYCYVVASETSEADLMKLL